MNYSQRKYIERLDRLMQAAEARMPERDPFSLRMPMKLYRAARSTCSESASL